LKAWFTYKLVVLRNLEAGILKTENLCGLVCGVEPGLTPRVYAVNATFNDRLAHGEK
jgi:hypothetical protein